LTTLYISILSIFFVYEYEATALMWRYEGEKSTMGSLAGS